MNILKVFKLFLLQGRGYRTFYLKFGSFFNIFSWRSNHFHITFIILNSLEKIFFFFLYLLFTLFWLTSSSFFRICNLNMAISMISTVCHISIQKIASKGIASIINAVICINDRDSITVHTIEFYVNISSIILFWIKDNSLNGN